MYLVPILLLSFMDGRVLLMAVRQQSVEGLLVLPLRRHWWCFTPPGEVLPMGSYVWGVVFRLRGGSHGLTHGTCV
jgi:hypothetical protein